jgi:hypothetical protein
VTGWQPILLQVLVTGWQPILLEVLVTGWQPILRCSRCLTQRLFWFRVTYWVNARRILPGQLVVTANAPKRR